MITTRTEEAGGFVPDLPDRGHALRSGFGRVALLDGALRKVFEPRLDEADVPFRCSPSRITFEASSRATAPFKRAPTVHRRSWPVGPPVDDSHTWPLQPIIGWSGE